MLFVSSVISLIANCECFCPLVRSKVSLTRGDVEPRAVKTAVRKLAIDFCGWDHDSTLKVFRAEGQIPGIAYKSPEIRGTLLLFIVPVCTHAVSLVAVGAITGQLAYDSDVWKCDI